MLRSIKLFLTEPHIRMSGFCLLVAGLSLGAIKGLLLDGYGIIAISGECGLCFISGALFADGLDRWKMACRRGPGGRWTKA